MRDFLLNEALKRLAAEAATQLSTLVASGDQIPFDVAEQDGPESLFYRYEPLTAQFVREREDELRVLPAFSTAREAVERAGIAATYLEARGEPIPPDPGARANRMLIAFIAALWDGCTEFSLDRTRLESALTVLDAEVCDLDEADVLVVPLVGLRMRPARLDLPSGVQIVRADAVEAPAEAMSSEGMERAAWEPQFLAVAEQGEEADSAKQALAQLRELISVMRLFKSGGIGLGPYAFASVGEGGWRRVATGAPPTRAGGYALSEQEATELVELARALEARPDPNGALGWAVRRFELGCARESALEGLSDHLLSLRAMLDGQGPVGATLSMRAAALICDETTDRAEAGERVDRALELERSLMSGATAPGAQGLAAWIENGLRRILCEAALGELGADLGAAAEETLIATGLEAGDAAIAISVQDPPNLLASEVEDLETKDFEVEAFETGDFRDEEEQMDQDTRIMEPVPHEDEIRITATNWLEEVAIEDNTLEWPAGDSEIGQRERIDTPRVRHLFPVPEDADWEVGELNYDHYHRHAG